MLILITGGARSGKSRLALELAASAGAPVTFVATGVAGDDEMAERIARHRAERPAGWTTIEEPRDLGVAATVADGETVVLDCLSLWLNAVLADDDAAIAAAARAQSAALAARSGLSVVVTNEVGGGIVPADPMTRRYRDLLGHVNAIWSGAADAAYLVTAGRATALRPLAEIVSEVVGEARR